MMLLEEELKYQIALTLLDGVGNKTAKKLVAYLGGARAVFDEKPSSLRKIPGNAPNFSSKDRQLALERAEEEILFIQKKKIKPLFFLNPEYPAKLNYCEDGPVMLYFIGDVDFNDKRIVSIVGTRNATDYGIGFCERFIADLQGLDVIILSGLAYGIDITAHKAAIHNGLPTVASLGHSLDRIYPGIHRGTAEQMLGNGGLLSEYISGTKPDRENFPMRNRIIAGMADATIVVEAGKSGGALITAELAASYNRDVFAVPGRVGDEYSVGCNKLIKKNIAAVVESAADFIEQMNWEQKPKKPVQSQLFFNLNPEEEKLVDLLKKNTVMDIDNLCHLSGFTASKTSSLLLGLEFSGLIKALPGKRFQIN
jgi:DNA processing protein